MENKLKGLLDVENKWYHKIPIIGKYIFKRQRLRKYYKNKFKIFEIVQAGVGKIIQGNTDDFFENFIEYDNIRNGKMEDFEIVDKYNYIRPNWKEIIKEIE